MIAVGPTSTPIPGRDLRHLPFEVNLTPELECDYEPYVSNYDSPSQNTDYSWSGSIPEFMLDSLNRSPMSPIGSPLLTSSPIQTRSPNCPETPTYSPRNKNSFGLRGGYDPDDSNTDDSFARLERPSLGDSLPENLSAKLSESDLEPVTDTDVTIPGESVCPIPRPSFLQRFDRRAEREIDYYKQVDTRKSKTPKKVNLAML